jgi:hypothetical protein
MDAATSQLLLAAGTEGTERKPISGAPRRRPQPDMASGVEEPAEAGPYE